MKVTSEIYKLIGANRSLEKLLKQDLNYPIRTAYKLVQMKKTLDETIEYVLDRLTLVYGDNIDFNNISDEKNLLINSILGQTIEIEIPDICSGDITDTDNVIVKPSDIENMLFLFVKEDDKSIK